MLSSVHPVSTLSWTRRDCQCHPAKIDRKSFKNILGQLEAFFAVLLGSLLHHFSISKSQAQFKEAATKYKP